MCQLCGHEVGGEKVPETLHHALLTCTGNHGLPQLLLGLLRVYLPALSDSQVLELDSHMEVPLVWLTGSMFLSVWRQRQEGRVCVARTRSELLARCRLLREGKVKALQNVYTLANIAVNYMFSI